MEIFRTFAIRCRIIKHSYLVWGETVVLDNPICYRLVLRHMRAETIYGWEEKGYYSFLANIAKEILFILPNIVCYINIRCLKYEWKWNTLFNIWNLLKSEIWEECLFSIGWEDFCKSRSGIVKTEHQRLWQCGRWQKIRGVCCKK